MEKKVHISIKDTGSGIDPSIIPHLFSKFTTKSKGGTGLGLHIKKHYCSSWWKDLGREQYKWKRCNIFI